MKKTTRGFLYQKTYNFVDRDPAMDIERTIIQRSGKSFQEIKEAGGATPTTLKNHTNGKTKRPIFTTLAATVRACGHDIQFVDLKTGQIFKLPRSKI